MGGFRLGKILGFEINVDWSWLLIFFLVVYTLSVGYFPRFYPQFGITTNWIVGILAAVLLFVSVLVHELSHSVVSRHYGTEIKGITLFLFGGMSQAADEPKSAREEFWMAIVGPLTSFALAMVFYVLGGLGAATNWPTPAIAVLGYLALINLVLGIFNMVPGFPLDGGRVLRSIIWGATGSVNKATRYASYSGQAFGYLLIAFGFINVLSGGLINGLWLAFIGWFLAGAARQSYEQMEVRQALSGISVERVMTTDVPVIPAEMRIREFVDDQLLRHDYSCYPVMRGDTVVGVVGAEEVRTVPSDRWDMVSVGEIVQETNSAYQISADDDVWDALTKLTSENACRLLVMEDNRLKGTLGRDSVYRLLRTRMQHV